MAKTGERIFALVLAAVFLITSLGFSGFVIWQTHQDNKNKAAQDGLAEAQAQLNEQANNQEQNVDGKKLDNFTPTTTPVTTLQKTDITVGTGAEATAASKVTVHYTGALVSDGTIFESSHDSGQPVSFELTGLIKGWQDGIPGMKVGGKRRLVIPYADAYGEEGSPPKIPAKSDLVFDIELIAVE